MGTAAGHLQVAFLAFTDPSQTSRMRMPSSMATALEEACDTGSIPTKLVAGECHAQGYAARGHTHCTLHTPPIESRCRMFRAAGLIPQVWDPAVCASSPGRPSAGRPSRASAPRVT